MVRPGNIFVAIPGTKKNGADFISQAITNGATLIAAETDAQVPPEIEFKKVVSARKALAELAADFYDHPSKKFKLIGITGTKGKTTTSYFIQSILKSAGYKAEVVGTINNALTTPQSSDLQAELARMVKAGVTHCIIEVSSHALDQYRVHACHFAVAIFTNLAHDHLDYHKNMEEYLKAKKKLFEMLPQAGVAIINVDDPASNSLIQVVKGEVVAYGLEQAKHELRSAKDNEHDVDVASIDIREDEMTIRINSFDVRTPFIGMHNVYNILAAFQCGLVLGLRQESIKKGIEAVKSIPGRQEEIKCGQPFRVIVDFAHTPDSLQKLIETYRKVTKGKIILVFGCPGDRDRAKRPMMGEIAARLADYSIVTTDDPHGEKPDTIINEIVAGFSNDKCQMTNVKCWESIVDRKEAIIKALKMAKKWDTVLIAGRGHEKYQDFNGTKVAIDDREICKAFLKKPSSV